MNLLAPMTGIVVSLDQVPDPVFSQRLIGDGIGIEPTSSLVVSPCAGKIVHLHPAHHALTIETADGLQVLIHIGLDTVELKGEGFHPKVKSGDQVQLGQPLIEFDEDYVGTRARSLITIMVVSESTGRPLEVIEHTRVRAGVDSLIRIGGQAKLKNVEEHSPKATAQRRSARVAVGFPTGLHARPAAQLVQIARAFSSSVSLQKGRLMANGKSVTSLLNLEAEHGDTIEITTDGSDAEAALSEILIFFDEPHTGVATQPAPANNPYERSTDPRILKGVGLSNSIVIGNVHRKQTQKLNVPDRPTKNTAEELHNLTRALIQSKNELAELAQQTKSRGLEKEAAIFEAHQELLEDPEIIAQTQSLIQSGKSAAFAWSETVEHEAQKLSGLQNELLAQRAVDLRDIGLRVLRTLAPNIVAPTVRTPPKSILVTESLTPSEVATLDKENVLGFCMSGGNATSHVAILASSMGIPALLAMDPRVLEISEGQEVLLNTEMGELNSKPSSLEIQEARHRQKQLAEDQARALKLAHQPAKTKDGRSVEVHANISSAAEARKAIEMGTDGVGLLRSEFLFLDRATPPSEDEQLRVYQEICEIMGERAVTIRTLDVGGDKPLTYLPLPKEDNPFLGLRGIRVSLMYPEIFRTQIRALLRVKTRGQLNIMFPMIATIEEFRQAREIFNEEMLSLKIPTDKRPPLGIMVEVPSVALTADEFAREVDFFSIGTNDLTQYTLAMDRGNQNLKVDALHPSVFHLIRLSVEAAHKYGKWVGVCGGIAGNAKAIPMLIGLGVDELSVSAPNIPLVKQRIRS